MGVDSQSSCHPDSNDGHWGVAEHMAFVEGATCAKLGAGCLEEPGPSAEHCRRDLDGSLGVLGRSRPCDQTVTMKSDAICPCHAGAAPERFYRVAPQGQARVFRPRCGEVGGLRIMESGDDLRPGRLRHPD
jgi:hypothetical protein